MYCFLRFSGFMNLILCLLLNSYTRTLTIIHTLTCTAALLLLNYQLFPFSCCWYKLN